MKKYLSVVLGMILTAGLVACGSSGKDTVNDNNQEVINNQKVSDTEEQETSAETVQTEKNVDFEQEKEKKVAVVYFSGTGNTREVANLIARENDADVFEIIPEDIYTSDDLNYNDDNCRANREMNDASARPAISNDLSAVSEYDVIYLGYPIWWGDSSSNYTDIYRKL